MPSTTRRSATTMMLAEDHAAHSISTNKLGVIRRSDESRASMVRHHIEALSE